MRCHTAPGFAKFIANAGSTNSYATNVVYEAITCTACHDPHDATNPHQLRAANSYTLPEGTTVKAPGSERPAPAAQRAAGADAASVLPDAGADEWIASAFAEPIGPAKNKEKAGLYDEKGLFDYIDGAAPVYIERHFRRLLAGSLAVDGHELTADVYEMTSPADAESIFAFERSPDAHTLADWPEAIKRPLSLVFHQARFYVKLTAFDATAEAALPDVARALRGRLR